MSVIRFQNRTLVLADECMRRTLLLASKAAESSLPVFLCGPSGTGKEIIARYIHEKGNRSHKPFISVNCAAIPEGLMEAELFGYERGSFTGALNQRIGKFERANGGTLLLDEISEMPISLQAKLLRVIQEGEVDRLGSSHPVAIDTRVIATTNRDPLRLIQQEAFREDLFYRLNVIRIDCEPLRGRSEAIARLAGEFIRESCHSQGRELVDLSHEALRKLTDYPWPGNIRELQNAVERAVLLAEDGKLEARHFDNLKMVASTSLIDELSELKTLSQVEQIHILNALRHTGGNRTEAASLLGISVRTLRNKLKLYGA